MAEIQDRDVLHRFLLERSGVRGVLVRLDDTWETMRGRVLYPPAVQTLLGEAAAAAALFTGHTKIDGRLSIQLKASGALRTLFAECTHDGGLRGLAHWHPPIPEQLEPKDLGADAMLAITIESRSPGMREPTRYQGLVGLDFDTLGATFENYFMQSEQLPTRLLLGASDGRATGLMLQQLPDSAADPDAWPRVQALFDTLGRNELRDVPADELLYRLFHEEGVRILATQPLRFQCSCSRERVAAMLRSLGRDEAFAALQGDVAEIICEFCNQHYHFDRIDVEQLFVDTASAPAPTRPQ
jgi:molecular chaperone Hsp33